MKKLLTTCAATAALGALCLTPALAQDAGTQAAPMAAQPAAPASAAPMQSDLTGQTIYSKSGDSIGTVTSVTNDASGRQQAVVSIQKFLGMGGKDVLFPTDSLTPRSQGGYTTSLTSGEIKKLPEASSQTK